MSFKTTRSAGLTNKSNYPTLVYNSYQQSATLFLVNCAGYGIRFVVVYANDVPCFIRVVWFELCFVHDVVFTSADACHLLEGEQLRRAPVFRSRSHNFSSFVF